MKPNICMQLLWGLLLAVFNVVACVGQASLFTYTFDDDAPVFVHLHDSSSVYIDYNQQLTIHDFVGSADYEFTSLTKEELIAIKPSDAVWTRLRLTNNGTRPKMRYFNLFIFIDTVRVYTIKDGQIINEQIAGDGVKPLDREFYSLYNNFPFHLDPGETKDYYFKIKYVDNFNLAYYSKFLTRISSSEQKAVINSGLFEYMRQFFYAGIMFLFSCLSLFMFYIFRERVFFYFTFLLLFFIVYFLAINHQLEVVLNIKGATISNLLTHASLLGVVVSTTFFFSEYIGLAQCCRRLNYGYYVYGFLVALFPLLTKNFLGWDILIVVRYANYLLGLWIVLMLGISVVLTKRGNLNARTILVATGVLLLSGLVYVLEIINVVPRNVWIKYSFQMSTFIFSGILFYRLLNTINTIRNERTHFEKLDKIKSRFFANISHEFRTPLTLILGPLKELLDGEKHESSKKMLQLAHKNAYRLLQLINQLLDLSKLEAGKMEFEGDTHNFSALLKGIVMSFESLAQKKNIRLNFVAQNENLLLFVDKTKIEIIFYNLLSNAFKFTAENGEVAVMVLERNEYIEILVRDTGIGISAEKLPKIFDRFFQMDGSIKTESEGTGIGLALVKELVNIHDGEIEVASQENKGTTFTIRLPQKVETIKSTQKDLFVAPAVVVDQHSAIAPVSEEKRESTPVFAQTMVVKQDTNGLPVILIIEDNSDVREYIKEYLKADFTIIEAANGEEGVELALLHLPDLVISDVMMPKKDGFEVCEILKSDERSSHIPIIMLTAKATQDEKIMGLETGADDYLIKPFDTRELLVRVRNLITSRKRLREQLASIGPMRTSTIPINKVDDSFVEKVVNFIQENLDNTQFGVEDLAKEIGMSKAHLNRKLNALCGSSVNKFIRNYRLEYAYNLLAQKAGNVSEVAIKSGFNSTAYFVKCFREKYDKTPGAVLGE